MLFPNALAPVDFAAHQPSSSDPSWWTALVTNDVHAWLDWMDSYPDIEDVDQHGMTPLHWACLLRRPRMAHELLALGANPWQRDRSGVFPWQLAMRAPSDEDCPWDQWPTKFPGSFAWPTEQGAEHTIFIAQALLIACRHQRWDVVQALTLQVNVHNCPGVVLNLPKDSKAFPWTLLPWAHAIVLLDLDEALPMFKAWGVDMNALDGDGRSALQWAVALGYPSVADRLIEAGAHLVPKDAPLLMSVDSHDRPYAVTLATLISPEMAEWSTQWLVPSSQERFEEAVVTTDAQKRERFQHQWDIAHATHGARAMGQAVINAWKRRYRLNDTPMGALRDHPNDNPSPQSAVA